MSKDKPLRGPGIPETFVSGAQLTVQDSVLSAKWESFLKDYYRDAVQKAAEDYSDGKRSVYVEFNDVQNRDPELADYLLNKPRHALQVGAQQLLSVDVTIEPRPRLHLRIRGLPTTELDGTMVDDGKGGQTMGVRPGGQLVSVRALRASHLGKFLAIEGLVKKVTSVRYAVLEAAFDCKTCGNRIRLIQEDDVIVEPVFCDGCEKTGPWTIREEECKFIDQQKIELQDNPDDVRGGSQPEAIAVFLQDDLVHQVGPGDRIRLNGILTARKKKANREVKTEFDKVVQAVSVEHLEHSFEDIVLTREDEVRCEALSRRPDLQELLVRSFARKIIGHKRQKESLLLAAFGSHGRLDGDGVWQRGDIHILLAGDPGTAKSELLQYVAALLPHVVQANGKSSSGVGLTAAAVRDDFGDQPWSLEAGVLVLANGGMATIDELDKMSEQDAAFMLDALAHQVIHIAKAGIVADMQSRCSVVAACNPEGGRFGDRETPASQLGLLLALLSRFDLPWAIRDRSNSQMNREIARSVLRAQSGRGHVDDEERLTPEDLRKYIAWAKKVAKVLDLDQAAEDFLVDYYDDIRTRSMAGAEAGSVTPRVPASLWLLATARARMHGRSTATIEDARFAVGLVEAAFASMGVIDADGRWDVAVLQTGQTLSQHERVAKILDIVREISSASPRGYALEEEVLRDAKQQGIDGAEALRALETLRRQNTTYAKGGGTTAAPMTPSGPRPRP